VTCRVPNTQLRYTVLGGICHRGYEDQWGQGQPSFILTQFQYHHKEGDLQLGPRCRLQPGYQSSCIEFGESYQFQSQKRKKEKDKNTPIPSPVRCLGRNVAETLSEGWFEARQINGG
jgi:hypothetical protein